MTIGRRMGNELQKNRIDGVNARENRLINHFFHDFKGEISTMIMCVEAVREGVWGPVNNDQSFWLEKAERNCHHMIAMINNYRDLSQMEEGSFPEEPEDLNLINVLEEIKTYVKGLRKDRGHEIIFNLPRDLPVVEFRARLFERILKNLYALLIENARTGGRIITEAAATKRNFKLKISYEGIEIEENLIPSLFDKYAQAKIGLQLGRGYTLLFCKEAATFLGGDLTVKAWPGKGNIIEVYFPLKPKATTAHKQKEI